MFIANIFVVYISYIRYYVHRVRRH